MPIRMFYRFTCPVCQKSQEFDNNGQQDGWMMIQGEPFNSVACAKAAYEATYGHPPAENPPA